MGRYRDDDDEDTELPAPLHEPPEWLTPWNYPNRITDELAIAIATEIVYGADLKAAGMKNGIAPGRLIKWLKWGEDAYNRDADGNDPHAPYLNLFIKVMQAAGVALAPAQRETYVLDPRWWLSHNPDHRGGWGAQGVPAEQLGTTENTVEADAPTPLPQPTGESWRRIIETIVASGGLVERGTVTNSAENTGSETGKTEADAG